MSGHGIIVFLGPSLPVTQAQALLPKATILPPARQGDLYRAARDRHPSTIALVDGIFATVPAVWHREILWAMTEARIRVFGAASMGALRAAELDVFGMVGFGKIYDLPYHAMDIMRPSPIRLRMTTRWPCATGQLKRGAFPSRTRWWMCARRLPRQRRRA